VRDSAVFQAEVEVRVFVRAAVPGARREKAGLLAEPALREQAGSGVRGKAAVDEAGEQLRAKAPPALVFARQLLDLQGPTVVM
jgi:hypothetical protein